MRLGRQCDEASYLGLRSIIGAACVFVCLLLILSTASAERHSIATREKLPEELKVGQTVDGQLTTGRENVFTILVSDGQFLRFRIAAENPVSNLQVTLVDPGNREIENFSGPVCPFSFYLIPVAPGAYQLRMQLLRKYASPENYRIHVDELHEATERDRLRVTAGSALVEAYRLIDSSGSREQIVRKSEEAISLFRAVEDHRGEAEVWQVLSFSSFVARDYATAIGYLQQAKALWHDLAEYGAEADALYSTANYLGRLGESEKRLAALQEALALRRKLGDRWSEALVLDSLGDAHDARGELQEALNAKQQALSVFRADKVRIDYQHTALADIGLIYQELGEPRKALDYHLQALHLARSHHNRELEIPSLSVVAGAYAKAGDKELALEYYGRALALSQGNPRDEAWTRSKLGGFYVEQGEYDKALHLFEQVLPYFHKEHAPGFEGGTLYGMGIVYRRQGMLSQALEALNQALSIWTFNSRGRRRLLREIGAVYQDLGDSQKALEFYERSLTESRDAKDLWEEALSLCDMARSERAMQHAAYARRDVEAGLQILESARARIASTESRSSYFASVQKNFEFYIDLLMQMHAEYPDQGLDAAALQASERARARSLLDTLAEGHADIHEGADPELLKREQFLQQRVRASSENQVQLLSEPHTNGQAVAAASQLQALMVQYDEIEARIRATSPHYSALTQPAPLELKQIQESVLDSDTLLLEYTLGEDRSYLWAVTDSALTSFTLPGRAEIERAARHVYELLTIRNTGPNGLNDLKTEARIVRAKAEYPTAALHLSEMILGPVDSLLGEKRLLIVSDGALQYIPFAALPVRKSGRRSQPLVVDSEIVTIPSASTIAVLRRELLGREPAPKAVAVFADPVFDSQDPRVSAHLQMAHTDHAGILPARGRDLQKSLADVRSPGLGRKIPRLPFSRREADAIIAHAPAGKSLKAVDFRASRLSVTNSDLAQYRIVHFATHGVLDSTTPALSGIVLSLVDRRGNSVDGFLRLWDIYNLRLPAELVVLSACQTALGKEIKGEGMIGLTRGFMYAGAPRVVASLWQVDDVATAELMGLFYEGILKKNLPPAAALRAAQVHMWKQPRWQRDPYFWSAFQLHGEWK